MNSEKLRQLLELILKKLPQDKEVTKAIVELPTEIKFIDLPPVSLQQATDIYAMSANGLGSYKETRAQLLSYIKNNVSVPTQDIFVSPFGQDTPGRGGSTSPYLTPQYANSQITTASSTNPIRMVMATALWDITGLQLKPYITYEWNGSIVTSSAALTLDASWSGAGGTLDFQNINGLSADINWDFQAAGSDFAIVRLSNILTSATNTYTINGNPDPRTTIVIFETVYGAASQPHVVINNCYGGIGNSTWYDLTVNVSDGFYTLTVDGFETLTDLTVNQTGPGGLNLLINSSQVNGTDSYINTGSGQLNIRVTNVFENSAPVLTGTPGNVTYEYDKLSFNPVITGNVTLVPLTLPAAPPTWQQISNGDSTESFFPVVKPFNINNFSNGKSVFNSGDYAKFQGYNYQLTLSGPITCDNTNAGYLIVSDDGDEYVITLSDVAIDTDLDYQAQIVTGLTNPIQIEVPDDVYLNGKEGSLVKYVTLPAGNGQYNLIRISQYNYILNQINLFPQAALAGPPIILMGPMLSEVEFRKKLPKFLKNYPITKIESLSPSPLITLNLKNPTPYLVVAGGLSTDLTLKMPEVNLASSCGYSQMPYLYNTDGIYNIVLQANDSSIIVTVPPLQAGQVLPTDLTSAVGAWLSARPDVINVNGMSGEVGVTSQDNSIAITDGGVNNVDLSASLQGVYEANGGLLIQNTGPIQITDGAGDVAWSVTYDGMNYKGRRFPFTLVTNYELLQNIEGYFCTSDDSSLHNINIHVGEVLVTGAQFYFQTLTSYAIQINVDPGVQVNGIDGSIVPALTIPAGYFTGILRRTGTDQYSLNYIAPSLGYSNPLAGIFYYAPNGSDSSSADGSQGNPFKTYEYAAALAFSLSSPGNPYGIIPVGTYTTTGNMILYPNVCILGLGQLNSVINILSPNQVVYDSSWGTVSNPICYSQDCTIQSQNDINLIYPAAQANSFLILKDVSFGSTPNVNIVGSGTASPAETVSIYNSINNYITTPTINCINVNFFSNGSSLENGVNFLNSGNQALVCFIEGVATGLGGIEYQTTSVGNTVAYLLSSFTAGSSVTVSGANTVLNIDSSSYMLDISCISGATLSANVNLLSLAEGINAASNFVPTNFIPTADTNWSANSQTGYNAGIDTALGLKTGDLYTPSLLSSTNCPDAVVAPGSGRYQRLNNSLDGNTIITLNVRFQFTPTAATGSITIQAPFMAGNFNSNNNCDGIATLFRTSLSVGADGTQGIIQSIAATQTIFIPWVITGATGTLYSMSCSLSYQLF